MKNKNYIICVIGVVIVLICSIMFTVTKNNLKEELETATINLQIKEDTLLDVQEELAYVNQELITTKEDLQLEVEKSHVLSDNLGLAMGELDELNEMLNVVKNQEYNVAYLGEFVYTYYCDERRPHICGGAGYTASGAPTEVGTTIAVDPTVIPLGSMVYIEGIGLRIAQDTGGAVKGNKIDILLSTHDECFEQTIINGGVWIVSKKTP